MIISFQVLLCLALVLKVILIVGVFREKLNSKRILAKIQELCFEDKLLVTSKDVGKKNKYFINTECQDEGIDISVDEEVEEKEEEVEEVEEEKKEEEELKIDVELVDKQKMSQLCKKSGFWNGTLNFLTTLLKTKNLYMNNEPYYSCFKSNKVVNDQQKSKYTQADVKYLKINNNRDKVKQVSNCKESIKIELVDKKNDQNIQNFNELKVSEAVGSSETLNLQKKPIAYQSEATSTSTAEIGTSNDQKLQVRSKRARRLLKILKNKKEGRMRNNVCREYKISSYIKKVEMKLYKKRGIQFYLPAIPESSPTYLI